MSAECTGWVYRHSPARGAALLVHLAIADSANDQHGYELWMRQTWLADKARVSRRAVGEALGWLVGEGLLELIESGKASGSANRYRFLMPSADAVWNPQGAQSVRTPHAESADRGAQSVPTGVRTECAHNPRDNPTSNPSERDLVSSLRSQPAFAEWWALYPYKRGSRAAAEKAWRAAVRVAPPHVIVEGVRRFAADPNLPPKDEARFVRHGSTWLRDRGWEDGPLPPRGRPSSAAPAQQQLDDRRDDAAQWELVDGEWRLTG
jgi:hypothetical protein